MKTNVSFECIIFFNYSLQLWSGIFSFWNIKLFDYYTRYLTTNQLDGHFTFNNIVNWFSITSSILKTVIQWKFWYCPRNVKLLRNFQIQGQWPKLGIYWKFNIRIRTFAHSGQQNRLQAGLKFFALYQSPLILCEKWWWLSMKSLGVLCYPQVSSVIYFEMEKNHLTTRDILITVLPVLGLLTMLSSRSRFKTQSIYCNLISVL